MERINTILTNWGVIKIRRKKKLMNALKISVQYFLKLFIYKKINFF